MARGPSYNHSYFYAEESEFGWGNTTYFTFFSEFNRPWIGLSYIEATVLILLFILSFLSNISIFYQIMNTKSTRTVTNYLICNLAVADILFTSGGPLVAVARISGTWILGNFVCKMMIYVLFTCAFVLIWTMTIISIDRNICINKTSMKRLTPKAIVIIIIFIWILAFASFIPLGMFFNVREFPFGITTVKICTLVWPRFTTFRLSVFFTSVLCVVGFVIPLTIMAVNYFQILRKFCRSRRAIRQTSINNEATNSLRHRRTRDQRDIKVVKTLVLIVVLFLLMWLPIFITFVAIQLDGMSESMQLSSQTLIATLSIALANGFVNPFIYGVMNDRLRRGIIVCFTCGKCGSKRKSATENRPEKTTMIRTISYSNSNT